MSNLTRSISSISSDKLEKSIPHVPKLTEDEAEKVELIQDACKWKDIGKLKALAASKGGFITDDLRRIAWPLLLGVATSDAKSDDTPAGPSWEALPEHHSEHQVSLDVNRAFIYYPSNQSASQIDARKEELQSLIVEVLRREPYLHYFQGYHDICQVFLLVLGAEHGACCAESVLRLSVLRIRDFMLRTLNPALAQLRLIPEIIRKVNPALYIHLSGTEPFFALSGTLTMYAHDIQEYGQIARLFDVFLANEAAFSVYMFAQIVLNRAEELFETPVDEPEMMHSILSKLPRPLDLEGLIRNTEALLKAHPPNTLKAWSSISSSSVLKTARSPEGVIRQSMDEGRKFFDRQAMEIEWNEKKERAFRQMWLYRKPAASVGMAVLAIALAFYIRKSQPGVSSWSMIKKLIGLGQNWR